MITLSEFKKRRVHFVGIGGSGMSGIARIALSLGMQVSGSDAKQTPVLQGLTALGAQISIGHKAEHVDGVNLLVVSGAIDSQNPEVNVAKEKGIEILNRAQALAILMSESQSVAVAGTHGKTTTTSMLTVALQSAGVDPSFAIGAAMGASGTNAHWGSDAIFIAEADESDGSFVAYRPHGAIITNIELDHVDHFPNLTAIDQAFDDFVASIRPGGFLVACASDSGVARMLKRIIRRDISVIGYGDESDYRLDSVSLLPTGARGRIIHNGVAQGEINLRIPGRHNLDNALAAIISALQLGAPISPVLKGLADFSGARRRFEIKGKISGVTVIDDYGHHPTEIEATLIAARSVFPLGKTIVIFQPHRYSRTQAFAEQFAQALLHADHAFVLDIYPASEKPIPGITGDSIARFHPHRITYQPSMIDVVSDVVKQVKSGDCIITMGAGDISALGAPILTALHDISDYAKD